MTPILKSKTKPSLAITIGDPAGIGIELLADLMQRQSIKKLATYHLIGHSGLFDKFGIKNSKDIILSPVDNIPITKLVRGKPSKLSGKAALAYLDKAVEILKNKTVSGLVTAPISKEAIMHHDKQFIGHTEYLAKAFNIKKVGMLFSAPKLKVIIVTRHIPVSHIIKELDEQSIIDTLDLTYRALKTLYKVRNPRIGICGLNPHAGENGKIGTEELDFIDTAIKKSRKQGIKISGPFAADTFFIPGVSPTFDCVVAMYHDQGLIPIKSLYFNKLVNVTIGLPFIRTSPAHGTAYDLVNTNKADPSSMAESIKLAAQFAHV